MLIAARSFNLIREFWNKDIVINMDAKRQGDLAGRGKRLQLIQTIVKTKNDVKKNGKREKCKAFKRGRDGNTKRYSH